MSGSTWYEGQPQHKLRRVACQHYLAQPKNFGVTGTSPRALYLQPVVLMSPRSPCRPRRNPKCHLRMLLVRIAYGCAPAAKVAPGYCLPYHVHSSCVPVQRTTRGSAFDEHSPQKRHPTLRISTGTETVHGFTRRHLTNRIRKTAREMRCGSQLPRHQARLLTCWSRATLMRWVRMSMPGDTGRARSSSSSMPSSSRRPARTRPAPKSDLHRQPQFHMGVLIRMIQHHQLFRECKTCKVYQLETSMLREREHFQNFVRA